MNRHIRSSGAVRSELAHSTPLECENVYIMFSIDIALRWSAAFSRGSIDMRNSQKNRFSIENSTITEQELSKL